MSILHGAVKSPSSSTDVAYFMPQTTVTPDIYWPVICAIVASAELWFREEYPCCRLRLGREADVPLCTAMQLCTNSYASEVQKPFLKPACPLALMPSSSAQAAIL